MRRTILGYIAGAACALSPSLLQAGFVESYATWQKMGTTGQYFYVMGLFDSQTVGTYAEEPAWVNIRRRGLVECAMKMKIDAPVLAGAVNRYWEEHPLDAGLSADPIFSRVVDDMCLDYVNARRTAAGMATVKRSTGSIMDAMKP